LITPLSAISGFTTAYLLLFLSVVANCAFTTACVYITAWLIDCIWMV
jgi:hypothetical protein